MGLEEGAEPPLSTLEADSLLGKVLGDWLIASTALYTLVAEKKAAEAAAAEAPPPEEEATE